MGDCIEFDGYKNKKGQGQLKYAGRVQYAHRVAFFEANGFWPDICRHTCGNTSCINTDHLTNKTAITDGIMHPVTIRTVRPELGFCVEWAGGRITKGYGRRFYAGRKEVAHRVAFFEANGYWPNVCRHKCDNPPCVRPDHLADGTAADNMRDMVERGRARSPRGETQWSSKLNTEAVKCIRWLYANRPGITQQQIATAYKVNQATVSAIVRRKIWKEVE